MYLRHHGSRSRQSYHGGSGNQPLWDLLLNESQNQRYDYCVHHYLRNNPTRKTQILCRISDRVTVRSLNDHEGKGSEIEFGRFQTLALLFYFIQFVKCWGIFLELNSKGLWLSSGKKEKIAGSCPRPPYNVSITMKFHVVVEQHWQKHDARANLLFCFSPFLLLSPLLELSIKFTF